MSYALIVDDDWATCEYLAKRLRHHVPDLIVETALSVQESKIALASHHARNCPFDVAILDMKIPETTGGNPEINLSLCDEIHTYYQRAFERTWVIHSSAFDDDTKVREHCARPHNYPLRNSYLQEADRIISKLSITWMEDIGLKLKRYLFALRIKQQLAELFADAGFSNSHSSFLTRCAGRGRHGLTFKIASLIRDVDRGWPLLVPEDQAIVLKYLEIHETHGRYFCLKRPG